MFLTYAIERFSESSENICSLIFYAYCRSVIFFITIFTRLEHFYCKKYFSMPLFLRKIIFDINSKNCNPPTSAYEFSMPHNNTETKT